MTEKYKVTVELCHLRKKKWKICWSYM